MKRDFSTVTELAGDEASREQVERLAHRYLWAGTHCRDRDVLEVACGHGQGLGYLASLARRLWAGDITSRFVQEAHRYYEERVALLELDAQSLPFPDASLDVVILFEAIYYLPEAERFAAECRRVLRPGGHVLIASANPDLWDFNPSPYSVRYFGVEALDRLFAAEGFECRFFGHLAAGAVPARQRMFRPLKKLASALGLIPRTMRGKKLLKRLVFGRLVRLPTEIDAGMARYAPPVPLQVGLADHRFKVIYLAARRGD